MLPGLLFFAALSNATPPALSAPAIVDRMVRADNDRLLMLAGYTGIRRYRFENKRVNKRAEMTVRVTCDSTGAKTFEVLEESGSGTILHRVLRKMIEAEREASLKSEHEQTRIIPANYEFALAGTDVTDGRPTYVLDVTPKQKSKFTVRGRIWVDAADYAIVRVDGQPAKNPSFWIRSVHIVQTYRRTAQFWLPVLNESKAEARIFGATDVSIEYFDYVPAVREAEARRTGNGEWKP